MDTISDPLARSAPAAPPPARPAGAAPAPLKKLKKRRWGWVVWVAAAALLVVGLVAYRRARATAPVSVSTVAAQRGSVRDFVTSVAAGRLAAKQEVSLRAELAAKVQKLHHVRGDAVRAGEPLVTYDAAELKERLRIAEAAVVLARAQLRQAEQNAVNAETQLARARRLHEANAIAPAELDSLEGQHKVMDRAADAARAAISQAAANVELARTALAKAVVVAPFAGTVLVTSVDEGGSVTPGTPLLELANVTELHVEAEVDEADFGRIRLGMPADLAFDAFPGERIRGTVSAIAPSVTRDHRGDRSVAIEIALAADDRLRVGMSADVDVIVDVREGVLHVPPSAVQGRGAERFAFVVDGGVAKRRTITVGIATWEAVEVRTGLAEGERVVASLSATPVDDGARVAFKPERGK